MLLHASRAARSSAPTPLGLVDLTALTREVADEVRAGRHTVHVDPDRRWYQLLRTDDYVDVWLISWATEQVAELHDHAGSLGALTVVSGSLDEQRWVGDGLRSRRLRAGRSVGFPLGHVHDVGNSAATPAISVHAYSPPLTAMSYYSVESDRRAVHAGVPLPGKVDGPVGEPLAGALVPAPRSIRGLDVAGPGLRLRRTRTVLVESGSSEGVG